MRCKGKTIFEICKGVILRKFQTDYRDHILHNLLYFSLLSVIIILNLFCRKNTDLKGFEIQ